MIESTNVVREVNKELIKHDLGAFIARLMLGTYKYKHLFGNRYIILDIHIGLHPLVHALKCNTIITGHTYRCYL